MKNRKYLEKLVNSIETVPNAFHIYCSDDKTKYIGYIHSNDRTIEKYYAVSALYDTVLDLDKKIKFSFFKTVDYNLPETLDGFNPFDKPTGDEMSALYYIENMLFRVSILWDMLAQLCNVIFDTKQKPDKIYYSSYFDDFSKGAKAFGFAVEVKKYLDEKEDNANSKSSKGNHAYLKDFRNQMTHRTAPNLTIMSSLDFALRPPAMYLLHRLTEDYYKVSSFLCRLINEFLKQHKDWFPFAEISDAK